MLNYLLRNAPPDLWQAVKHRAGSEGRSVRDVILDLLRLYVDYGLPPRRAPKWGTSDRASGAVRPSKRRPQSITPRQSTTP